ncbi:MAG: DsbA family protein [Acidobacteriaceae bacterium]|nr:DsbA family protein [Acidobacteriaceae bacterium]
MIPLKRADGAKTEFFNSICCLNIRTQFRPGAARYAERIGLDVKKFRSDLKERRFEDRLREQFRRGVQNGVYGTPGLFVNEVRYAGKMDLEDIKASLQNTNFF